MFRRKEDTIAPDASYPANLKELGFFINNQGQIRMIEAPERHFLFNATNNERHNEMRNEALHTCSRAEVIERLSKLGIRQLYLPQLSTTKPNGPHIPILTPPLHVLKARKRVVVIINDTQQDLGILAYRHLQRTLGLNGGSVVNFAKEMINRSALGGSHKDPHTAQSLFEDGTGVGCDDQSPGLFVMNTGQSLYSHKYNRPVTMRSWDALPRKSIAHDRIRIHDQENYVTGHRISSEHIQSVFDDVLCNADYVDPRTEIYVVAIEDGATNLLDVIKGNIGKYGARITALAMVYTLLDNSEITDPRLKAFMHGRTRQWKYSDLSCNPTLCTQLPDDYSSDSPVQAKLKVPKTVRWDDVLPEAGPLPGITKSISHLTLDTPVTPSAKPAEAAADVEWGSGDVPCPTFAGGKEPTGECVFTEPDVQRAILSFFEEVAQDPENYRNPKFATAVNVPQPTADAPFALDANATMPGTADIQPTSPMMTPEQAELVDARARLEDLRTALKACPDNVELLAKGRARLMGKIVNQETLIKNLQVKALGSGSLGAGEAEGVRQGWNSNANGSQVPFAGTMVDSELLKAAGLGETAREGLEKAGTAGDGKESLGVEMEEEVDVDEEKAFL